MKNKSCMMTLGATAGCIAALVFGGAVQAKTKIINLGNIDAPEKMLGSFKIKKNETIIFEFDVSNPYDFDFTAMVDGKKFLTPLVYDAAGGSGMFTETIGAFSHRGWLDYSVTASVPEPATWGLMIFGMGAVGGVARRRNRSTQPA